MQKIVGPADRLKAAADTVIKQAMEYPELGIPADPDVAEFMGCFEENAVSPDAPNGDSHERYHRPSR